MSKPKNHSHFKWKNLPFDNKNLKLDLRRYNQIIITTSQEASHLILTETDNKKLLLFDENEHPKTHISNPYMELKVKDNSLSMLFQKLALQDPSIRVLKLEGTNKNEISIATLTIIRRSK